MQMCLALRDQRESDATSGRACVRGKMCMLVDLKGWYYCTRVAEMEKGRKHGCVLCYSGYT